MNNEEARFLLSAYRSNGRDAGDPVFAEALGQAERDPAVRDWLRKEQAVGGVIVEKLREVRPPAGLRESILAGARFGVKTPWWRRTAVLAAAAGIAVLLAVAPLAWRMFGPVSGDTLPEFAINFASSGYMGLKAKDNDVEKLKAWLAAQQAPLPARIPPELVQLGSLGCRTVVYEGRNVSLICFGHGREFHLFVARREDFPTAPPAGAPRFETHKGWGAASWSDDRHYYVLVSAAGPDAIKQLL
jgi:hypothetical protein